jgi:hypothetical protein
VVQAVADFMVDSQDPAGGWRYPHPRSSALILDQAVEHAWQIAAADALPGPRDKHPDAVERVLRQRYHGWKKTGLIPSGVTAWELAAGKVKNPAEPGPFRTHALACETAVPQPRAGLGSSLTAQSITGFH